MSNQYISMLVVRLIFIFLFGINIVFAGDISQIVFTNEQRTIKPNEAALLTIQLQYSGDSHPTACMLMFTNSNTGQFSSSNTNWNSVDKLTINSNWTNKNFYYKDSTAGTYVITVKVANVSCSAMTDQEAQWTAEQNIIISDGSGGSITVVESAESQTTPGVGLGSWPVEPQIYANAGPDKTAVAGADVIFLGKALGLNKEPLENARYLWNFGDGAMAEGQNVKHVYKYPGEYIVVLDVSSGKYSASDRAMAKIIPNQLEIVEANQNYIKLHNGSNVELDISFWFLRAENSLFKFPLNTFIKTNKDLMIDSSISGLRAENQKAEILYPNGSMAFSFTKSDSTTVVESKPMEIKKAEVKTENLNLPTSTDQTANVASVFTDEKVNQGGAKKWIWLILGLGIFAGAGFIFIRRH